MGPAWVSRINAFPRTEEHLTRKTLSGGLVTVLGVTMMLILVTHEISYYLATYTVHEMAVDTRRSEKLTVNLNITFPRLPCSVLSLDALDMSGKHEVDISTNIWKIRLDSEGQQTYWEALKPSEHVHDHGEDHSADNPMVPEEFGKVQGTVNEIKQALARNEGCRVHGSLSVQRVAGNFHISVHGQSYFVLQQVFTNVNQVNVSHHINTLSFGPRFPGLVNPLDGYDRMLPGERGGGTFKYFIKVVPTTYSHFEGDSTDTNQYSVTEYFTPTQMQPGSLPAVYFLYDLSPITHSIKEQRRNFFHFATRLCAVVGGTFAVTGNADSALLPTDLLSLEIHTEFECLSIVCDSKVADPIYDAGMVDKWIYLFLRSLFGDEANSLSRLDSSSKQGSLGMPQSSR